MMDKNPLLKYVMKSKTEDVMHSSAYAKAQNGEGFGTSSSKSFEERMKMEQNRTRVRAYGESKLMNDSFGHGPRAKTYEVNAGGEQRFSGRELGGARRTVGGAAGNGGNSAPSRAMTPPVRKNPGISR